MSNSTVIEATYENGVLRPSQPLDLEERQIVHLNLLSDPETNQHPHITQIENVCGGRPVIRGTRIPVKALIGYHRMNYTSTEILEGFPGLTTAQLYDALSYYYDNQAQMDADMAADELPQLLEKFDLEIDDNGVLRPASTR